MEFQGRTVLVTGAGGTFPGRGSGRALAEAFGRLGAMVVAVDIDGSAADATATSIRAAGGEAVALPADVSSSSDVERVVRQASRIAPIDVLISHVGLGSYHTVTETDDATWERIRAATLDGPFFLARAVLPAMVDQQRGVIVNTISIAGIAAGRSGAAYTASKHGLVGLTKNIAVTYGSHGIRCNGVCPGRIRAAGEDVADAPLAQVTSINPAFELAAATKPRDGTPGEVVAAVVFLASDAASYINGAILPVDGGWAAV